MEKANVLMTKLQNQRHSDDEHLLAQFWQPTFGYGERLMCFYRAPITLYTLSVSHVWLHISPPLFLCPALLLLFAHHCPYLLRSDEAVSRVASIAVASLTLP